MPETTPEDLFNQFMEQQQRMSENTKINTGKPMVTTEEGLPVTPQEQAALETIKTTSTVAPAAVSSFLPTCPQCGQLHPPIPDGKKCPMAKDKFKDDKGEEIEVDINKYLTNLKNIVVSQIEMKGIKDPNKLFKHLTVELMKVLEAYNE